MGGKLSNRSNTHDYVPLATTNSTKKHNHPTPISEQAEIEIHDAEQQAMDCFRLVKLLNNRLKEEDFDIVDYVLGQFSNGQRSMCLHTAFSHGYILLVTYILCYPVQTTILDLNNADSQQH